MKLNIKWRNVTGIFLLVVMVVIGLYDLIPACTPEQGDTVSELLSENGQWALLLGYLCGHFWPIKSVLRKIWAKPEETGALTNICVDRKP